MSGKFSGSGEPGSGHSQCITAALVTVKFRGFSPQAMRVQYGAPEPPEKRDHCSNGQVVSITPTVALTRVKVADAHQILVRVHIYEKAIFLAFSKHTDSIVYVFLIILPTTV